MKRALKRWCVRLLRWIGRRVPGSGPRHWIAHRAGIRLLDPAIIEPKLAACPLRSISRQVLCNPYTHTHAPVYWCGVLYESSLAAYLKRNLHPGDTVLDVGCNAGQIAVYASYWVGSAGRVIGYEANAELAATVQRFIRAQGIETIQIRPYGLSHESDSLTLHVPESDLGSSSLHEHNSRETDRIRDIPCELRVGDRELAAESLKGRVFLKIDVEGHELSVLKGLQRTLAERIDHAVIEITPEWIGGASAVAQLFTLMAEAGFEAHELGADGTAGSVLVPEMVVRQTDVLFLTNRCRNLANDHPSFHPSTESAKVTCVDRIE